MNEAQKQNDNPYSTMYNKLKGFHRKKHGGQTALLKNLKKS